MQTNVEEQVAKVRAELRKTKREEAECHLELAQKRLVEWLAVEADPDTKDRVKEALQGTSDALEWVRR